jgi:hypothetical protein
MTLCNCVTRSSRALFTAPNRDPGKNNIAGSGIRKKLLTGLLSFHPMPYLPPPEIRPDSSRGGTGALWLLPHREKSALVGRRP